MAMAQCMPAAPWPIPSISPPSSSSIRRKFASLCRPIVKEIHLKRLPFDMVLGYRQCIFTSQRRLINSHCCGEVAVLDLISVAKVIFSSTTRYPTSCTTCLASFQKSIKTGVFASKQSSNEQAWRRLSAVAASLSSASPEEDSASFPSKELGPKIDLNHPRRKLQVSFTCDACGVRSQRLINPNAYARGTVFVQCAGCDVYHKLVDNLNLIEEYDFRQETDSKADDSDVNVVE